MQPLALRNVRPVDRRRSAHLPKRTVTMAVIFFVALTACGGRDETAAEGTASTAAVTTEPAAAAATTTPTTTATTTTLDPDALVMGEVTAVAGLSTLVGSGTVMFEAGSGGQALMATMDGSVPVVDGAGEVRFCHFCVDDIQLGPGVEVPIEVLADRAGAAYSDLGWTVASAEGVISTHIAIVKDPATGLNVMKLPMEIESVSVIATLEIPLDGLSLDSMLIAGPEGCVLKLTSSGIKLVEGSVRLIGA